jgi:hypothetical protein
MKRRVTCGLLLFTAASLLVAVLREKSTLPAAAADLGGRQPTRRDRAAEQPDPRRLLRLAVADPARARREAGELSDPARRTQALLEIAGEMVRSDARAAFAVAADLPPGPEREDVLLRAIREWALADPLPAIEGAKATADEPLRERLFAAALVEWSEAAPEQAARAAALDLHEGRIQDDAVVSIAQRWAQASPAPAAAWVESFPPGGLRDAARSALAVADDGRDQ